MRILVTGAAGFIGFSLARKLLARGDEVIGIDSVNDYYDVGLKEARLAKLREEGGARFDFVRQDFADYPALVEALAPHRFDRIVHLGAQAGVRYSITHPHAYLHANLAGHLNMLEIARHRELDNMVYASSSSVYGPWGRPDMMMWIFTKAILAGQPIPVFNHGEMYRDFTFIDDIIAGVMACLDNPAPDDGAVKAGGSTKPHRLYNIGNHKSEHLMKVIAILEEQLGKKAIIDFQPMQPGDVPQSFADIAAISGDLGYRPTTSIDVGVPRFVEWYKGYCGV